MGGREGGYNALADKEPDMSTNDEFHKPVPPPEEAIPMPDPPREPREPRKDWRDAKIKDKSVWFRLDWGCFQLKLNPIVTSCSIVLILAFILWCTLEKKHANDTFKSAKTWVTRTFTWLYVGSQDIWAILIIAIYFSKYGALKLGKDDEEPEYPDGSWFAMLFACGVGVGLFFYGVAEPLFHYIGPNRYTADQYMPDNEVAQWAMNLTFFHWGIHGWIVYVMVGIMLGFMSFRKGMPMTMKTCFYPLIGDRIYGWMGDMIDIFSIITTLFGVCTSLGFGTMQVNSGLNFLNDDIEISTDNQVIIIWAITIVATTSVITGVGMGIRRLSEVCFGIGMVIMLMVLFLEDTWYILNLYCQSMGFYLQWIIQLGFHCDAFELSTTSYGASQRGRAYVPETSSDGPADWMDAWTIFYWGWWISWSPFVGSFIAKISRGRTIRQFINGSLTAPMIYSFLWLTIFGGSAIKNERLAIAADLSCCPSWNVAQIGIVSKDTTFFTKDAVIGEFSQFWDCTKGDVECAESCEWKLIEKHYLKFQGTTDGKAGDTLKWLKTEKKWLGKYLGKDIKTHARLSCMTGDLPEMWFANISVYGDMGDFLSIISLVGIILYFVTSSDSGSLVIDIMSANGDQEPPIPQRVFWALVEGATATALLVSGGTDSLTALQTASIVSGLPYTIILCFLSIALWRALAMECGDLDPYAPDFRMCLVDPFATLNPRMWWSCFKNIFIAPMTLYEVHQHHKKASVFPAVVAAICWVSWVGLIIAEIVGLSDDSVKVRGIYSLAWVFYLGFVTVLTATRVSIRNFYAINGNPIEDFFAVLFVYPVVMAQLSSVSKPNGTAPMMPDNPDGYKNAVIHENMYDSTMA